MPLKNGAIIFGKYGDYVNKNITFVLDKYLFSRDLDGDGAGAGIWRDVKKTNALTCDGGRVFDVGGCDFCGLC
mgnify:CR=1 FL=1